MALEKFKIQFTFEISGELSEVRLSTKAQRFQVYADYCFSVGIIMRKHNSRATPQALTVSLRNGH